MVPTKPNGALREAIFRRAAMPRKRFLPSLYPLPSPPGPTRGLTMTTLILAAAHQMPRASGFAEVALLSGFGLFVSLLLVHFGIDLGTVG